MSFSGRTADGQDACCCGLRPWNGRAGDTSTPEYNQVSRLASMTPKFYDFFAGAGLVTLALQDSWQCIWANDIDAKKELVYRQNFGGGWFVRKNIAEVEADELPDGAQMAWASFPCQDLSLAGWRRGLSGERSGTFWHFWRLMNERRQRGAKPPILVLENVVGLLYGDSFTALCEGLAALGMQFGALVIDARHFLPQSRPRVFIVAADADLDVGRFCSPAPEAPWTPPALAKAVNRFPPELSELWRWWTMPIPNAVRPPLDAILEADAHVDRWHTAEETEHILSLMSESHLAKINAARQLRGRHIGFLYRRIRQGVQRAEVRFDGVAGCLRTPQGGSSRQTILIVENGQVRTRLLTPREAARLMGVPDTFVLPPRYSDAYRAMGDGVAVPVVKWLSRHLLAPLARVCPAGSPAGVESQQMVPAFSHAPSRAMHWSPTHGKPSADRTSRA